MLTAPLPLFSFLSFFLSFSVNPTLTLSHFLGALSQYIQDEHFPPLNHIPLFASLTHFLRQAFKKLIWMLKNTIANTSKDTEKAILTIERVVNCQLEGNIVLQGPYTFKGPFLCCKTTCQSGSTWGNFVFH